MGWLANYWRCKDFIIYENDEKIIFSYNHGDMGLIDKITYDKKSGFTCIYDLDNYYGNTVLYHSLYL